MTGRSVGVAAASIAVAMVVGGCTGGSGGGPTPSTTPSGPAVTGELRLVSFDSCDDALSGLRQALLPLVGPYGIDGGVRPSAGAGAEDATLAPAPGLAERSAGAPQDQAAAPPEHSSTNTHEAGVDEPDLVKTDGKRIVTVVDGSLRVVDAAARKLTGTLALPQPRGMDELLLSGDHALLIRRGGFYVAQPAAGGSGVPGVPDQPQSKPGSSGGAAPVPIDEPPAAGSELLLVDLAGAPRVLATFAIDGRFVDARMVGSTARVVTHSQPRLTFGYPTPDRGEAESLRMNRDVVGTSSVEDWLPRYRVEQGGSVQSGRVDCASVARPANYSATSMLTVLSFDLGAAALGTGDPVTIVADGDIVYGTADSLYVASDTSRVGLLRGGAEPAPGIAPVPGRGGTPVPPQPAQRTELYKFDISGTGRPRHVASGAVPGSLLNQYSMSQFDGHLRVATTLGWPAQAGTESTVYVLAQRGAELAIAGKVGGLGKGERIYAVRFVGPVGYVVTFRQTDPLYTLDLRDPAAPKVSGELKITGYSAYLHPAGDGRVIGVGQEASEAGRVQGTQVSLFDVSDPAAPRRIAQYHLPGGSSEAEFDPHAFLYWAATGTLVLPIASYLADGRAPDPQGSAVVLRVGEAALTEVGRLHQPVPGSPYPIRRALVVGDTLWTVSELGAAAAGLVALDSRAWVPFTS
ncbi:MAG TPA: beta-propeller domain-containing protein [Pseudonocardiaceae bacterium]